MTMIFLTQERLHMLLLGCGVDAAKASEIVPAATRESAKAELLNHTDAESYRWLRKFRNFHVVDAMLDTTEFNTLDAAVAAAMAREPLHCDGCGKTIAEHDKLLRCGPAELVLHNVGIEPPRSGRLE